jgi:hypothetical protein
MCDIGEKLSNTMKREFMEEALDSQGLSEEEYNNYKSRISSLFNDGIEVIHIDFLTKTNSILNN